VWDFAIFVKTNTENQSVKNKKRKKHGYAERLKYMHMLENGYTIKDYQTID
jgi:hypothetical protein